MFRLCMVSDIWMSVLSPRLSVTSQEREVTMMLREVTMICVTIYVMSCVLAIQASYGYHGRSVSMNRLAAV